MITYFDIHLFTHYIPSDGHNVTLSKYYDDVNSIVEIVKL
jgi:hypothetical protein